MIKKSNHSDFLGNLIKLLLCLIIWYKEAIQNKFFLGANIFLVLGVILSGTVFFDLFFRTKHGVHISKIVWRLLLYFLLSFVLGLFFAYRIDEHINYGITVIEFSLIMLYVCYYSSTRNTIEFLIWNFFFVYVFMLIVFLINPTELVIGGTSRYSYSAETNPNSFAISMSTGIWAILYLIARKRISILLGFPLCGAMLYAIFMTGARKGLIAALLCFALWFILYYFPLNESGKTAKRIGKIFVSLIIVIIMVFILLPYFKESVLSDRLVSSGGASDGSTKVRLDMYTEGLNYISNSPLVGYGFWGFASFYGAYSHSTWIEAFVSSGVILGFLYLSVYFSIWRTLFVLYKRKNMDYYKRVVIAQYYVLFLSLLFYSIVTIHFYDLCIMICLGMIISSSN